ncbi:hypothetical protein predicted by Glimmer/Critica [Acetobacter ghanensis]|uniref:Uncharacterized protein n=1 Tax=Acetobacter ghanensis TaxID=431306 RepID=A0A0U5F1S6_9PROT|nr:hypothetical protein predicted by Glimmer/Critica [Acetobacter ghanensis]
MGKPWLFRRNAERRPPGAQMATIQGLWHNLRAGTSAFHPVTAQSPHTPCGVSPRAFAPLPGIRAACICDAGIHHFHPRTSGAATAPIYGQEGGRSYLWQTISYRRSFKQGK